MREVLNNILEKMKPLFTMTAITFAIMSVFISLVLYLPVEVDNDKVFKVLAVCEIALIIVVSVSMYRLLRKDASLLKRAAPQAPNHTIECAVIDGISVAVMFIDGFGRIRIVNKVMCQLLGMEYESIVEKHINNIFVESSNTVYNRELSGKIINAYESNKEKSGYEIVFNKNENIYRYLMNIKLNHDNEGNQDGIFIELVSVPEKVNDLQKLIQIEKLAATGQMVAGLAHEIKNSICSMRGLMQVMKKRQSGENEKYYDVILEEITQTNVLLQNMLSLTRTRTTYESIEVSKIITDIIPIIESQAAYNNININFDIQQSLPQIYGNKEYIKQVVVNIVQNAMEELAKNGNIKIRVWLDKTDNHIKLEFKDDGPGIKAEHMDKIFEPFFTTKEGGSGLGLAISCEIIKSHRGKMSACNNADGGATFLIELPVYNEIDDKYCKVS